MREEPPVQLTQTPLVAPRGLRPGFDPLVGLPIGIARGRPRSQETARRNAMTASTALAARRRERLEVEEYLHAWLTQRAARLGQALRHGGQVG